MLGLADTFGFAQGREISGEGRRAQMIIRVVQAKGRKDRHVRTVKYEGDVPAGERWLPVRVLLVCSVVSFWRC